MSLYTIHGVTYEFLSEIIGIYDDKDIASFVYYLCTQCKKIKTKFMSISLTESRLIEDIEKDIQLDMEKWK